MGTSTICREDADLILGVIVGTLKNGIRTPISNGAAHSLVEIGTFVLEVLKYTDCREGKL